MTDLYGSTRSVTARNYSLLTPDGFVSAQLPGWHGAQTVVVISPAMGARFAQLLVTFEADGGATGTLDAREMLLFVCDGALTVRLGKREETLSAGGYAFLPAGSQYVLEAAKADTRLLVFARGYLPLPGQPAPEVVFGQEQDVKGAPFLGDKAAMLKTLLPDTLAFDMAVNIFTFEPGATLPFVETHIMEHGLLMLQGQGIYRLDGDWHPVQAGDVIWMAPFCPQWFVATGKTPARYIYYKDVNRDPLG